MSLAGDATAHSVFLCWSFNKWRCLRGPCLWQRLICCVLRYFPRYIFILVPVAFVVPFRMAVPCCFSSASLIRSNAAPVSFLRSNAPAGFRRSWHLWHSIHIPPTGVSALACLSVWRLSTCPRHGRQPLLVSHRHCDSCGRLSLSMQRMQSHLQADQSNTLRRSVGGNTRLESAGPRMWAGTPGPVDCSSGDGCPSAICWPRQRPPPKESYHASWRGKKYFGFYCDSDDVR
jgi:hypothetical protein